MMTKVNFTQLSESRNEFWRTLDDYYRKGSYTDLEIVVSNSSIFCHQFVLASISRTFRKLLRKSTQENVTIVIPDQNFQEIKDFVDNVYNCMRIAGEEASVTYSPAIEALFNVRTSPDEIIEDDKDDCDDFPLPVEPVIKVEPKLEEYEDYWEPNHTGFYDDEDDSEPEEDEKPLTRRKPATKQKRQTNATKRDRKSSLKAEYDEPIPKKKRIRYPEVHRTFEDVVEVSDINERKLLCKLLTDATATLEVNLILEPLDVNLHLNKHHRATSYFLALFGLIEEEEKGKYRAKPLVWSFPDASDLRPQFDNIFDAYRAVFGLSNSDICYTGLMYSRQGLYRKNRSKKVKHDLKRRYAKLPIEELQSYVNQPDIMDALKRYPVKPPLQFNSGGVAQFSLDASITPNSIQGVALVSWRKDGGDIEARMMTLAEDEREDKSLDCMKAVFETWSLDRQMRIPKSDYLCKRHDDLMVPMETYSVYQDFLLDVDGDQRKSILQKERQCSDCGRVFECVTVYQDLHFNKHRRMHYFENFTCDCVYDCFNLRMKMDHVRLMHSDGKYSRCAACDYVGLKQHMEKHPCFAGSAAGIQTDLDGSEIKSEEMGATPKANSKYNKPKLGGFICCDQHFQSVEDITKHVHTLHNKDKYVRCDMCNFLGNINGVSMHKSVTHFKQDSKAAKIVCEICGKGLNNRQAMSSHKLIHKKYKCDICGEESIGPSAFATHQKNAHNISKDQNFPCEVCGKEFPKKSKLKHHFIRIHMDDKDCPFQCDDCGRGFPHRHALTSHQMMAHIKTRPYKCRYGCGADYNDHASRGTHELKKHGARYPNENLLKRMKKI